MIEVETIPVPVEPTTPIKPSEALRLGRLVRPLETEGALWDGTDKACALGAMALGYGWDGPTPSIYEFDDDDTADIIESAYLFVEERSGITPQTVWFINDHAERGKRDAAVLAYLEARGL
jgi:hypothetical protein